MKASLLWISSAQPPWTGVFSLPRALVVAGMVSVLLPAGCATVKYQPGERLADPALLSFCQSRIHHPYRDGRRLTQRILVHHGGDDFDMIGYLFLDPDGSWRAVALGDMGIERFRFRGDAGHCEVTTKPASLPDGPLRDGVIGDIQHLFGRRGRSASYLVRRGESVVGLVIPSGVGDLDEYDFSRKRGCLMRSFGVSNGRVVREAVYSNPVPGPGDSPPLPCKVILHNHKWRYSMEIVILEIQGTP